jgi:hypothetical protein
MSWLDNFKLKDDLSPKDLALIRMGATMMGNNSQGFGPALGSGISAGLDEYSRGVEQAERSRHRQRLEEFRQRQLDISAASTASTESYHNKSLAQQKEIAKKKIDQAWQIEQTRIGLDKQQLEIDRLYKKAQGEHLGAQSSKMLFELERLRKLYDEADAQAKLKEKLADEAARKEAQEPGFFARLFSPRPVTPTPLEQRDPAQMNEQDLMSLYLQRQSQEAQRQQDLEELIGAFSKRVERREARKLLEQLVTKPPGSSSMQAPSLPGMMQRYK